MSARGGGSGIDLRQPPAARAGLMAGVVGGHSILILLLLAHSMRAPPRMIDTPLATFDVAVQPPKTPPPPEPTALPPAADVDAGGSPGRRRQRASAAPTPSLMPTRSSPDQVIAEPARRAIAPAPDMGLARIDLGGGGGRGGEGDGSGAGSGSGGGDGAPRYARADWIVRPSDEAFARYWPHAVSGARIERSASVLLACMVDRKGEPRRCRVVATSPDSERFGSAAIRVLYGTRVRAVRVNGGDLSNLPVLIPIEFAYPGSRVPAVAVSAEASALRAPARP